MPHTSLYLCADVYLGRIYLLVTIFWGVVLFGQPPLAQLSTDQVIERAYPAVALVLVAKSPNNTFDSVGAAVVVRDNGVLLTAYHLVKDARAIQVRFKNGEVFDDVQLLGIDRRRDVAAIKISATELSRLPTVKLDEVKTGETVIVVSHPAALPWSSSTGIIAAQRLADEVPGAGSGYRLIQFTAPASPGSSGGVLIDSRGRALGLIVGSVQNGQNLNFAVPIENVLGLADAPSVQTFENSSALNPPSGVNVSRPQPTPQILQRPAGFDGATPEASEKSELLKNSKDRDFILRNFRTMYVDARRAQYFGSDQMKAALGRNNGFNSLNIRVVDDPKVADVVLDVGYTFAWDFPFQLKHQNTTTVLISGKGVGPFSGPLGAADVANQFVKLAKPYRVSPQLKK